MTAEMPAPLTRVRDVRDDTPPDGWVPTVPEVFILAGSVVAWDEVDVEVAESEPLPEVVVELAEAFNLDEQAADWRSHAAWARTEKKAITAAKRAQRKRNKAYDAEHADDAVNWQQRVGV